MRQKLLLSLCLLLACAAFVELLAGYLVFYHGDRTHFGLEAAATLIKRRFFYQPEPQVKRDASGQVVSTIFEPDPMLGYRYRSGAFTITLGRGAQAYDFRLTTDANGRRVTSFLPVADGRKVWVLGDSLASGWINSDETSFPFLLQARLPGYRVINRAVPGYGPTQAYLQLAHRSAEAEPPAYVFVAFEDFLFDRLVGAPDWIKALSLNCPGQWDGLSYPVIRAFGPNGPEVSSVGFVCQGDPSEQQGLTLTAPEIQALAAQTYQAMANQLTNSQLVLLYLYGTYSPEVQGLFATLREAGITICDARPPNPVEQDTFAPLDPHTGPKTQRYYAQTAATLVTTGHCPQP